LLGLAWLVTACKQDPPVTVDLGHNYYPLSVGSWVEYQVDSIAYDEFNASVDSFLFFLREECVEVFVDLEGRDAFRFERYIRSSDTASWRFRSSFYVVTESTRTEQVESNVRQVVLTYPPSAGKSWDRNAFNSKEQQSIRYLEVDMPYGLNGLTIDSVAQVILQSDTDNFIVKSYSDERYARNIGLVQKEFYYIETQFNIDSGVHWIQTARSWGP
jgi:hypothetical protein